ncbi:hypothetical protein Mia14_0960 [Candidatus Mancarchaeum acidiphilum]|uniref:Uncharacterized protein n=1 Tax=Candidatus Mancarchaeum acidiphilum TaxID=1920749 RepID=A0A218NP33_9ARCH|nr:hypothetical protein [Candidatus Mancarchaeum acidiphilum]ASI14232.1 hypothetical protein Mia14_0960 [Candidatus Mancarchaeum acidiphilum]
MDYEESRSFDPKKVLYLIIGIIIIGIGIYFIVTIPTKVTTVPSTTVTTFAPANKTIAVELTDPLSAPPGTSSLVLNYTNFSVLTENGIKENFSAYGSVNLMNLSNYSDVIAVVKIPSNTLIRSVAINIKSGYIVIDNNTYPLNIINGSSQIAVLSFIKNDTGLMIRLNPGVMEFYNATNNQTKFGLEPYGQAFGLTKHYANSTTARIHMHIQINSSIRSEFGNYRPNVTITSTYLAINNSSNETNLRITVRNNNNYPIIIRNVMLYGNMQLEGINYGRISPMMPFNASYKVKPIFVLGANSSTNHTIPQNMTRNNQIIQGLSNFLPKNIASSINVSVYSNLKRYNMSNLSISAEVANAEMFRYQYHNVLNFLVLSNGSLELPFNYQFPYAQKGYVISPHSNETFTYYGSLSPIRGIPSPIIRGAGSASANGSGKGFNVSGNFTMRSRVNGTLIHLPFHNPIIMPIEGEQYKVVVMGENGVFASANVTAS